MNKYKGFGEVANITKNKTKFPCTTKEFINPSNAVAHAWSAWQDTTKA